MTNLTAMKLLRDYRDNATPFMRDQLRVFHAMSASDQREFLFFTVANMALNQAVAQECQEALKAAQANLQ